MNMSTSITIRVAQPSDVVRIASFNTAMAWETEKVRLDPDTVHKGVLAIVTDPAKGHYFVAEIDGSCAGCLMITHEWSDWRNGDIWWIQSVYVDPAHRRKGVFKALYRHIETRARAAGVVKIRLYVERDNSAGKRTYDQLGMQMTHYDVMEADVK